MNPSIVNPQLQAKLANILAEVGVTADAVADAALATSAASVSLWTGAIACALPNEWFGTPNSITGDAAEEAAIDAAFNAQVTLLNASGIAISSSIFADPLTLPGFTAPTPTATSVPIQPAKNQVTSPPAKIAWRQQRV